MRGFLSVALAALVVSVGGFLFSSRHIERKEPVPVDAPKPPSINWTSMEATQLQELCQRDPKLVKNSLRNRLFQVHGIVEKLRVSDLDSKKAQLTLTSRGRPEIVVVVDLSRSEIPLDRSSLKGNVRWVVSDHRLFLASSYGKGNSILVSEGQNFSSQCRLERYDSSTTLYLSLESFR